MSDPEFSKKRYYLPPNTEAAIWQLQRAMIHDGINSLIVHLPKQQPSRISIFDERNNHTYIEFEGRETFETITRDYF